MSVVEILPPIPDVGELGQPFDVEEIDPHLVCHLFDPGAFLSYTAGTAIGLPALCGAAAVYGLPALPPSMPASRSCPSCGRMRCPDCRGTYLAWGR